MRPGPFFVLVLVLVSVSVLAQDIVLGGTMSSAGGFRGPLDRPDEWVPYTDVRVSPILNVYGPTSTLRTEFDLRYSLPSGELSSEVGEINLTLYPADAITVTVGRSIPEAGAALLLSPVNYLGGMDLSGLAEPQPSLDSYAMTVGATYVIGQFYLAATISPIPEVSRLLELGDTASDLPFLNTIEQGLPGAPLTRNSVSTSTTEMLEPIDRVSGVLETGWTGGWGDVTLFAYRGLDRIPAVQGTVTTSAPPPGTFDLDVAVVEHGITSFGGSLQAATGPFMLWGDLAFTFNRTLGTLSVDTDPVASETWQTQLEQANALDVVGGVAAYLPFGGAMVAAEYRHGFFLSERDDILRLDLPGTLLGSGQVTIGDGLDLAVTSLLFLADMSGVAAANLNFSPWSELTAGLSVPFTFGPAGSLFRGFESLSGISLGVTYRF